MNAESRDWLALCRLLDDEEPVKIETRLIESGCSSVDAQATVRQAAGQLQNYRRSIAGRSTLLRSNVRKIVVGILLAVLAVPIAVVGQFSTRGEWHLREFDWRTLACPGLFGLLAVACVATGCSPLWRSRRPPAPYSGSTNANPELAVLTALLDGSDPSKLPADLEILGVADAEERVQSAAFRIRSWVLRQEHADGIREANILIVAGALLATMGIFMFCVNQNGFMMQGPRTASAVVAILGVLLLRCGWKRQAVLRAPAPKPSSVEPPAPRRDEPSSDAIVRRP
jgi:hypothetical protein